MEQFHIVQEVSPGKFTEVGEVIDTTEADALARCAELAAASGSKHGIWCYDTVTYTAFERPVPVDMSGGAGSVGAAAAMRTAPLPTAKPVTSPFAPPGTVSKS